MSEKNIDEKALKQAEKDLQRKLKLQQLEEEKKAKKAQREKDKQDREAQKLEDQKQQIAVYRDSLLVKGFKEWNSDGHPKCTIGNVKTMLEQGGIDIYYDVIRKDLHLAIPNSRFLIDTEKNDKMNFIVSMAVSCDMSYGKVEDFVAYIASQNPYNPVAEWVESKKWDGTSRLKDFYSTVTAHGESDESVVFLKETLMKRWMVSAIAAAYQENGVSAHGVLVFTGKQYLGKTNWFKNLVPKELKVTKDGAMLDPKDKDSVYQAVSHWIVELGELDATFRKADIAQLKAFIPKDKDTIRLPYRREPASFARRTVFFASVNDTEYLSDPTGNRRFWTIDCESINHTHGLDMQQIWAEAYELYKAGESWYLTHDEMVLLNKHNSFFEAEDPFEVHVEENYTQATEENGLILQATDIAKAMGYSQPTQKETRAVTRAIRKVLNVTIKKYGEKKGLLLGLKVKPKGEPKVTLNDRLEEQLL